ncbi:hypothetical protein J6590_020274 [Homalodisca vitripennis]|nr:hypothetical protein J6590_020274 [Homalodisca vitripennis]
MVVIGLILTSLEEREQHTQHPEKLNVWLGILRDQFVGPFFIDGNLDAEVYQEILQNQVHPAIQVATNNCNEVLFQLDGAPPHYNLGIPKHTNQTPTTNKHPHTTNQKQNKPQQEILQNQVHPAIQVATNNCNEVLFQLDGAPPHYNLYVREYLNNIFIDGNLDAEVYQEILQNQVHPAIQVATNNCNEVLFQLDGAPPHYNLYVREYLNNIFIDGNLDAEVYQEILQNQVHPAIQVATNNCNEVLFQLDGAPPHYNLYVREYLNNIFIDGNLDAEVYQEILQNQVHPAIQVATNNCNEVLFQLDGAPPHYNLYVREYLNNIFIDGNLDAEVYQEILQNQVHPAIQVATNNCNEVLFQLDGAPPHYNLYVREYLNNVFTNRSIGKRGRIESISNLTTFTLKTTSIKRYCSTLMKNSSENSEKSRMNPYRVSFKVSTTDLDIVKLPWDSSNEGQQLVCSVAVHCPVWAAARGSEDQVLITGPIITLAIGNQIVAEGRAVAVAATATALITFTADNKVGKPSIGKFNSTDYRKELERFCCCANVAILTVLCDVRPYTDSRTCLALRENPHYELSSDNVIVWAECDVWLSEELRGTNLETRLKVDKLTHVFHICLHILQVCRATKTYTEAITGVYRPITGKRPTETVYLKGAICGSWSDEGRRLLLQLNLPTLSDKETCRKSGELCSLQILGLFECSWRYGAVRQCYQLASGILTGACTSLPPANLLPSSYWVPRKGGKQGIFVLETESCLRLYTISARDPLFSVLPKSYVPNGVPKTEITPLKEVYPGVSTSLGKEWPRSRGGGGGEGNMERLVEFCCNLPVTRRGAGWSGVADREISDSGPGPSYKAPRDRFNEILLNKRRNTGVILVFTPTGGAISRRSQLLEARQARAADR